MTYKEKRRLAFLTSNLGGFKAVCDKTGLHSNMMMAYWVIVGFGQDEWVIELNGFQIEAKIEILEVNVVNIISSNHSYELMREDRSQNHHLWQVRQQQRSD